MSQTVLLKGIVRHPHVFTPSAPRGTDVKRYSIQLLVAKNDPQVTQLLAIQQAEITAGFPSGLPPKADVFINDIAAEQGSDPRLHNYYAVSFSTKEDHGKPTVVNENHQPIINPAEVSPGDIVWVNGAAQSYTAGDQGVKCYFNGLMTTGLKGDLPVELLSSRPSAQQMFAGATAAPAAPAAPVRQMTTAATATYEAYRQAGWSDEQLISGGFMLPPAGVATSFA